ncbi:hypothetical protein RSAG8_07674, partial [Rhizoctonia solani AG-8 WAC10335]
MKRGDTKRGTVCLAKRLVDGLDPVERPRYGNSLSSKLSDPPVPLFFPYPKTLSQSNSQLSLFASNSYSRVSPLGQAGE